MRPSTAGLEEGFGGGGFGSGYGSAGAACLLGKGGYVDPTDYRVLLLALLRDAAAPCFFGAAADLSADVFMETTFREVVDVRAEADDGELRACVEETAWSIEPGEEFEAKSRFDAAMSIP